MNHETKLKKRYVRDREAEVEIAQIKGRIMLTISRFEKRKLTIRTSFWTLFAFVSSFGLVTSSIAFYQQFVNSGARELFAVAISDTSVILANGTEFFYSLAESMPVGNVAGALAATAALLYSLRHLAELFINNYSRKIYGHE